MKWVAVLLFVVAAGVLLWNPTKYDITVSAARQVVTPSVDSFTVDKVVRMAPKPKAGKIALVRMADVADLKVYVRRDRGLAFMRLAQREIDPVAIVIEAGHYDFTSFAAEAEKLGALRKDGGAWLLRLPLLVARGAALTVSDAELRLSRERGAFIANSGDLFLVRAKVAGWSEAKNKAAEPGDFRPFINTWSGGRMVSAASSFSALGYEADEGVSFQVCSLCLQDWPDLPPPAGIVTGSRFTGMFTGLKASGARKLAVVNSAFEDNARRGIDLDADTGRVLLADNTVLRNGENGIVIYDSPGIMTLRNKVSRNGHSGILINHSDGVDMIGDTVSDNGRTDIVVLGGGAFASGLRVMPKKGKAAFKIGKGDQVTLSGVRVPSGKFFKKMKEPVITDPTKEVTIRRTR